jgi:peptide/nickel transport system substrate-binding protein
MNETSEHSHGPSASALGDSMSRRAFLKGAAGLSASATAALALAGCGSSAKPAVTVTTATKPRKGGRLRVGITGGGSSDTLDAQAGVNDVDFARIPQLNEPLTAFDHNANVVLWLAEELTPNADASEWTIRVRDGVTFHDGKPLQAEDVIFSFQRILNPKAPLPGASSLTPLDINGMKKLDARTARFTCHSPFATFPQVQPASYFFIVPEGYNPKLPVGTGPFKYQSFEPGVQSVFTRNENYWVSGRPYVDEVVIVDYADPTTQVNALMAKDIDCANLDTVSIVPELRTSGIQVLVSTTGFMTPFTMRADVAPFNDVRVRQAMRIAVDRPQMRGAVFDGDGLLGNDIFSPFDPAYDTSIPQRHQDIGQAKSLLKQAGHESLTVQLVTSDISPGTINAAQALKQQVSAAGINVQLRQITPSEFFGSNYLQWTFSQDYWTYIPYLVQCSESMIKGAAFSETKFANPRYDQLYRQALSIVDDTKRADVIHEMMMIDYNEGTYVIPYFLPAVNGYGSNVRGASYDKTGVTLANADFKDLWFD